MAVPRKIESYEDFEVWQLAMTLAEQCYQLTATFLGRDVWLVCADPPSRCFDPG
jgi:hypothetical protein